MDNERFLNAVYITPQRIDVDKINIDKFKSLNVLVAKIRAVHMGGNEVSKANSDLAKGLKAQLLLVRDAHVIIRANLCVETGLVNGSIRTVDGILFEEN